MSTPQKVKMGRSRKVDTQRRTISEDQITKSFEDEKKDGGQSSKGTMGKVLMEGWGTKESGQAFLGQHNWKYRLFILWQKGHRLIWSYYKEKGQEPKGEILLTAEYVARELECGSKSRPNIFTLGPLEDMSALRTYFVSCKTEEDKIGWITMINSAIEGCPEKAAKRMTTYRIKSVEVPQLSPSMSLEETVLSHVWRMEQWATLCHISKQQVWKKCEEKNNLKICRDTFKNNGFVVVKVEGKMPVSMEVMYEFMQTSLRSGGKLDFIFRKEILHQKLQEFHTNTYLTQCTYDVPLPGMKSRDISMMRSWVPDYLTGDGSCGLVATSVEIPNAFLCKEDLQVKLGPSGFVLRNSVCEDGEDETEVTFIVQIDVRYSLQSMLRGSFKSGLIHIGLRNAFNTLKDLVVNYNNRFIM